MGGHNKAPTAATVNIRPALSPADVAEPNSTAPVVIKPTIPPVEAP